MSIIHWRGEEYVSMAEVATCFDVAVVQLDEWIDEDLIAAPVVHENIRVFPLRELDRIALIIHYTRTVGLDVSAVSIYVRRRTSGL